MLAHLFLSAVSFAISASSLPPCETSVKDALALVHERQTAAKTELYDGESTYLALGRVGITDQDLPKLCALTWIVKIDLFNDASEHPLTGKNLEYLGYMADLEDIDLDANALPATALKALAPLKKLKNLRLYDNPLGGDGIEAVNDMVSLEKLYVHADGITDADLSHFAALAGHPNLKYLILTGNHITTAGLVHLRNLGVEYLDLTGNALDVPERGKLKPNAPIEDWDRVRSLEHVAAMPNLVTLRLGNNQAYTSHENVIHNSSFFAPLANVPKLKHLSVEGLQLDGYAAPILTANHTLERLNLSRTNVSEAFLNYVWAHPSLQCVLLPSDVDLNTKFVETIRGASPHIKLKHYDWDWS